MPCALFVPYSRATGVCRINGLTHINLTKLDVLSDLATIQLGVAYSLHGQRITTVPAQLEALEAVTVEYEELPGWQSDLSKVGPWVRTAGSVLIVVGLWGVLVCA